MSLSMTQFLQPRMVLAPVIMLYVRMWDLEDEEVLFNIRCFYGASQTLLFGTLMYIRFKIHMEGNKKVVRVSKLGQPSMMDPTAKVENTVESMTVEQYEHELVMKECQQYLVSTAMAAGFLHTYLGFIQPLVITAIFGPYTATSKPMFRVHVLGEPAEGRLSRPYDEITGTGGIAELSAKVKKQYGIQAELTGSKKKKQEKMEAKAAAKQAKKAMKTR